jgi:(2Fe-2S) ferredoxin
MESAKPAFEKYIFVCTNERAEGDRESCGKSFCGKELHAKLKEAVKLAGMADKIRVSKSGCLDVCEEGANILFYPENIWLNHVELSDISAVLEKLGIKA